MLESATYEIKLPQFEGPFDLRLFLIERDELDIYDIPIAKITNDFLGYMHEMKSLNFDLASEFILVAATLMRIKAKMLLPRKELDEQGNEIDPRQDLVQALLEYKRYKEVVEDLQLMETQRRLMHQRGIDSRELRDIAESAEPDNDLGDLTLYKLMRVFQKVLNRLDERRDTFSHQVVPYPYTVEGCREELLVRLKAKPRMDFEGAFEGVREKIHAVFLLLAVLELVQSGLMTIQIGVGFNNFWLDSVPAQAA